MPLQADANGWFVLIQIPRSSPEHVSADVQRGVRLFRDDVDTARTGGHEQIERVDQGLLKLDDDRPGVGGCKREYRRVWVNRVDQVDAAGGPAREALPAEQDVVHVQGPV